MINIRNISKTYKKDNLKIYSSLNLSIKKWSIVSIIWPNWCWKSTLLNIISGIDNDFEWKVLISNSEKISYMFQKDLLIPWRNIYENISIWLEINNKKIDINFIDKLLNEFNLSWYWDIYPESLSWWEKQKVSLLRNIIMDNNIIIMDEPFSAIDFNSKMSSYKWFLKYCKKNNKTVLFVTHDIEEAITLSDRIIILWKKTEWIIDDIEISINKKEAWFEPIKIKNINKYNDYLSYIWKKLSNY